jgi:hypothetical protein
MTEFPNKSHSLPSPGDTRFAWEETRTRGNVSRETFVPLLSRIASCFTGDNRNPSPVPRSCYFRQAIEMPEETPPPVPAPEKSPVNLLINRKIQFVIRCVS